MLKSNFNSMDALTVLVNKMLYVSKYLLLLGCAYSLVCCNHPSSPKNKKELIAYVNDKNNGLIKSVESGEYLVNVLYQPIGLAPNCQKCSDYLYFKLEISASNISKNQSFLDARAFPESVETFAFRMGQYTNLVTPLDTIYPADYTFQRTFGLDKKGSFLFVFPKEKIQSAQKFTFLLKRNGLIDTDTKIIFSSEDIKKTLGFTAL